LSKYAMTAAHEVSAARELISIAEKWQYYFDICDYRCMYMSFFRSKGKAATIVRYAIIDTHLF